MSIKGQAAKGVMWNAIERFSTQGIQFVLTILIARVLSPDDYALIAMLGIFMAIAQTFVDSGLSNALIQKKNRTELDCYTMFFSNLVFSIVVYLLLFLIAPYIASFYNQPSLVTLLRVLGLQLITNAFGVVQMTRFMISMDFKKLAVASLISVCVSGIISVWMAYHGYGAWTLVAQILIGNAVWALVLWIFARWVPSWKFSYASFRTLFSFGAKLLGSTLIHTLYVNMYSLVIGKFCAPSVLGYFNRSYTLGQFPVQNFSNIVQKVLYPVQCQYQDDAKKFNTLFSSYLRLSALIVFPVMIGLAVLAEPVIGLLLGDKWLPAAPFLQIICISLMWLPVMQANVSVLDAKGRSDAHLKSEIIKKAIAMVILGITVCWGIYAICWGMLIYSFFDMGVVIAFSRRLTGIGYRRQMTILLTPIVLSSLMGGTTYMATCWIEGLSLKLWVGIFVGVFVYALMAYYFCSSDLRNILSFIKRKTI